MATRTQPVAVLDAISGWWPSKYGADDGAGAPNEITAGKTLEAVRLVRQGRIYDLAHVLYQDVPAFPGRTFRQYLDDAARDQVHEFLLVLSRAKLRGATGAWVAPLAIV
jgi:hypothetical protein